MTDPQFGLRFYAGMPVRLADGQPVGALCAMDQVAGAMSDTQLTVLRDLAGIVEDIICLRAQATDERQSLLQELRRAAAHGAFTLQWQPIARTEDLQVYGHEALVRWTRPNGAPPGRMISFPWPNAPA